MKNRIILLLTNIAFVTVINAQDAGKIVISNGSVNYPKFIASLNGVRLANDYNLTTVFNYLDETNYKVKILQAGSVNVLSFIVNSTPNYISKYLIDKDNMGNYSIVLESKTLMNGQDVIVTNTLINTPPSNTVAVPVNTVTSSPAMNQEDYTGMLEAVKKESFDSEKLDMAKTFFGKQNLSSVQVLGIVKLFSHEDSKITFAKFAYSRTVDKHNYYKVYDGFSFSSSKKQLSDYIKSNP